MSQQVILMDDVAHLGKIGDIGILGVVAARGEDNLLQLMNAPYSLVETLSERIAFKIARLVKEASYSPRAFAKADENTVQSYSVQ